MTGTRAKQRREQSPFDQLKALLRRKRLRRPVSLGEDHILSILTVRRARDQVFGRPLFADPAWDILLELYAAHLGARRIAVADLIRSIDVPASTATRWIRALEEHGFIGRDDQAGQFNSQWVRLTDQGLTRMRQLADHWGSAFLSI